jgi:ATP-dependent 26S proteasome regulatory subunit
MSSNDLEGDDIWGDDNNNNADESKQEESKTAEAGTSTAADESEMEDEETRHMAVGELRQRIHLLNNDIRVMKSDVQRITHESRSQRDRIRENQEKVKLNKQLPYLVANVVEVLEPDAEDGKWRDQGENRCRAYNAFPLDDLTYC